MLSFLSRLAPYRKAIVAAVGAILTAVAPLLPVGSTAAQVITTVLAIGTTLGVFAVPNKLPLRNGGVVTGPGPFLEVRHDPAPFVVPNATLQRLRGMTAAEAEGYIPRKRGDAAPATSTTTPGPTDPTQARALTGETQTGGSTTPPAA